MAERRSRERISHTCTGMLQVVSVSEPVFPSCSPADLRRLEVIYCIHLHTFQRAITCRAMLRFPDFQQAIRRNLDRQRRLIGHATDNDHVICNIIAFAFNAASLKECSFKKFCRHDAVMMPDPLIPGR